MHQAIGQSHLDLALASLLDPERFHAATREPYRLRKHLMAKVLISRVAGTLADLPRIEDIRSLPSFAGGSLPQSGDRLCSTVSHPTSPGKVFLLHEDLGQVMADYERLRAWEAEGLFVVSGESSGGRP